MFPPQRLTLTTQLASEQLRTANKSPTTTGEMMKFFGLLILIAKFEFGSRASLWSTTAPSKHIPAPQLGRTGMSRHRFDATWKAIRFSRQPDTRPEGMSSEQHRWKLVDDFPNDFNDHR